MQISSITYQIRFKLHELIIITSAATLIAGGFFISTARAVDSGDPCADGIPDASIVARPGAKHVGESFKVTFDGSESVACDSPIVSYDWDFGDGNSAQGIYAQHRYGPGTFTPRLTVTDEAGLSNTRVYSQSIVVKTDNQAPTMSDATLVVDQGGKQQFSLSDYSSDPDGDDLSDGYSILGTSSLFYKTSSKGTLYVESNGEATFYSSGTAHGTETFQVAVNDGFGGEAIANVTVNIVPKLVAHSDYISLYQGDTAVVTPMANDFSADERPFNIIWFQNEAQGISITDTGGGTYKIQAHNNFSGATSFEYSINTTDGGQYLYSRGTVHVEVKYNHPPVAKNDEALIDEDTSGNINILANDNDPENGVNGLKVFLIGGSSNGKTVLNPDNTFTYTPYPNFYGSDQFRYRITDSNNKSSEAVVYVTVNPINDAPLASFTYSGSNGGWVNFDGIGSRDVDGQIVRYSWDLGDGNTASGRTFSHKYKAKNRSYNVKLTVTDNEGATASYNKTVYN